MTEEKTKRGPQPVSYLAYESALARANIVNRRLAVLLAGTIAALIATNAAWIVRRK